jgi:competence ComEA-like helix-hairpin-helix protein
MNINEASMEELTTLPGVGESLAERIIAARPFKYLEDMETVSGIGPNYIEQLRLYVDLPMAPTDGKVEETSLPEDESAEGLQEVAADETEAEVLTPEEAELAEEELPEVTPVPDETSAEPTDEEIEADEVEISADEEAVEGEEQVPPEPTPAGVSSSQLYGVAFLTFFFTLVIATALSIGVIAAINNGNLMFASTNQAAVLAAEIDQLETSIQTVQSDLESLRGRVDSLEALGDRVGELETSVAGFQEELDTTTTLVEDLDQRVEGIETEITQVKGSVERFQVFFEGLRQLLTNVFTAEETDQ